MKWEEKQLQIRGKGIKDPVFYAITTDKEGINHELNSQEMMVPVIEESNQVW